MLISRLHLCSKPEIEFVSCVGCRNDVDSVPNLVRFRASDETFLSYANGGDPHNFVTSEATQFWKRRPSVGVA